ncbi:hypothetical protein FPV67DRAFT_68165 [Lyophyllum atratum]|nr:hypothetical protein FPV67DRAFT_68165 [Lyophyllum atratum]
MSENHAFLVKLCGPRNHLPPSHGMNNHTRFPIMPPMNQARNRLGRMASLKHPLHSTPTPTRAHLRVANDEAPTFDSTAVAMDPHFAHLLSALAISASANEPKSDILSLSSAHDKEGHEDIDIPLAINGRASTELHTFPRLVNSNDWSASAPQHRETSSFSSQYDNSSLGSVTPSGRSLLPLPQTPQSPISSSGVGESQESSTSMAANHDVPAQSVSSHTADISPYLSPPIVPPTPVADRSKQHIALLEAVSAESARLMQAYKTAAANGIAVNVTDNFKYPVTAGFVPTPSATPHAPTRAHGLEVPFKYPVSREFMPIPPGGPIPPVRQDPRVLYMSGPSQSSGQEHIPVPQNTISGAMYDPFQVRPRTSLSYHRGPGPMNPNPSGSASMNQSQLLALMTGHVTNPHVPYGGYTQAPQNRDAPLTPFYTPVLQRPRLPFYPPQFTPHQVSGSFTPVPTSPLHRSVQAPPPTSNTLLSILNNGRGSSRVSNVAPYPPTPLGRG